MSETGSVRAATPWWFWVISGLALVWNLMGVMAFFVDLSTSHADMIDLYGQKVADAAKAQPVLITAAYGLAVFGGAIGCLLLLLRQKLAIWALLISLLCVLIQQIYSRFIIDIMGEFSMGNQIMYASIPIVAFFLFWFARKMAAKNIIT